jgi:hypothetical protein
VSSFKRGDIVRLCRGTKPLKVEECISSDYYNLRYLHSNNWREYEPHYNIVMYEEQLEQNEKEENMKQLYEISGVGGTTFGTKLAVNSEGKWVMEEKGTGSVVVADPSAVKKVMPYTIGVKFGGEGQEYSYLAEKGKYEKGQTFLVTSNAGNYQIAVVHRVDTESEKATKNFSPIARILTEAV